MFIICVRAAVVSLRLLALAARNLATTLPIQSDFFHNHRINAATNFQVHQLQRGF